MSLKASRCVFSISHNGHLVCLASSGKRTELAVEEKEVLIHEAMDAFFKTEVGKSIHDLSVLTFEWLRL